MINKSHNTEVERTASLSVCGTYRWNLERRWETGPQVCWVMLNPSKANAEADDPTLMRCAHFSRLWGYGGLVVVNLFPFRSPSPRECRLWLTRNLKQSNHSGCDELIRNEKEVVKACMASDLTVAAWGNQRWAAKGMENLLVKMEKYAGGPIYCLGTTLNGSPKHPLARGKHRVPNDQQPLLWRSI